MEYSKIQSLFIVLDSSKEALHISMSNKKKKKKHSVAWLTLCLQPVLASCHKLMLFWTFYVIERGTETKSLQEWKQRGVKCPL